MAGATARRAGQGANQSQAGTGAGRQIGDFKPLQDGVQELRIDHGPGYRVYLSRQGPVVVLLLCGSDKSGQAAAIKQAVAYLDD